MSVTSEQSSIIEVVTGGTMYEGPDAVRIFKLKCAKHAIQMESKGLRITRGPKLTGKWAKHYGLRPRAKAEDVIACIDDELVGLYETVPVVQK